MNKYPKWLIITALICGIFNMLAGFISPNRFASGMGWLVASLWYLEQLSLTR